MNPGLTGLAQIRGRNELTWTERIDHDLEYVATQSPWLDLRICLATVRVLLTGAGVEGHPDDDPLATPPARRAPTPATDGLTAATAGARAPC